MYNRILQWNIDWFLTKWFVHNIPFWIGILDESESMTGQTLTKSVINQVLSHRCPHSVVTRIGSVTRDQKVPGSNPVWVGCCGVDIYQWCMYWFNKGLVVCITVCGCVHLKDPLESVEKSRGLSPGSRVSVCRRYVHNSGRKETLNFNKQQLSHRSRATHGGIGWNLIGETHYPNPLVWLIKTWKYQPDQLVPINSGRGMLYTPDGSEHGWNLADCPPTTTWLVYVYSRFQSTDSPFTGRLKKVSATHSGQWNM